MTAKEYLNQIRLLQVKIRHREEQLAELRADATRISSSGLDGVIVQSSGNADKMAQIVTQYVDMAVEIEDMIATMRAEKKKRIDQIHALPDVRHVECLELRYVDGQTWEAIAEHMGYTVRQIFRIHGHALQSFQRLNMS